MQAANTSCASSTVISSTISACVVVDDENDGEPLLSMVVTASSRVAISPLPLSLAPETLHAAPTKITAEHSKAWQTNPMVRSRSGMPLQRPANSENAMKSTQLAVCVSRPEDNSLRWCERRHDPATMAGGDGAGALPESGDEVGNDG